MQILILKDLPYDIYIDNRDKITDTCIVPQFRFKTLSIL